MTINKKTSLLSDSRFPTFIRGNPDFDMLRRFVQSYFESLESEGMPSFELSNSRENSDVDSTTSAFLDRFYQTLCPHLPKNLMADKRFLLKHSRELYQKKGTPDSFKLLFRVIFNEFISLKYPNENILRASDGIWNQPIAIQVLITSGNPTQEVLNLVNHEITTINGSGIVRNFIRQVRHISGNTFEFRIDKQKNIHFLINDTVQSNGITGIVEPTPSTIKIIKAGKKFTPGQLLKIDIDGGVGTLAKVIQTNSEGGIKKLSIIKFGYGYSTDFSLTISPSKKKTNTTFRSLEVIGPTLPINDSGSGFLEFGTITQTGRLGPQYDYFAEDYVDIEYVASTIRQFESITPPPIDNEGITEDDYAILNITVGSISHYPGFWRDSRGKLSDPLICLQDNDFYQDFSYVIQSPVPREKYIKFVKETVHPAGMKVFSDLLLSNEIDLSNHVANTDGISMRLYINDIVDVPDEKSLNIVSRKTDEITVIDAITKSSAITKNDAVVAVEAGGGYFASDYMAENYVEDTDAGVEKHIQSAKIDVITPTEFITKSTAIPLSDFVTDSEEGAYVEDGYWEAYSTNPNQLSITIN